MEKMKEERIEVITIERGMMNRLEALLDEEEVETCDYLAEIIQAKLADKLNFYITVVVENHRPQVDFFIKGYKKPAVHGKKGRRSLAGTYTLECEDTIWSVQVQPS